MQDIATRNQSRYDVDRDTRGLLGMKRRQQYYANKNAKQLKHINHGNTIRMTLSGHKRWTAGTCLGQKRLGAIKSGLVGSSIDKIDANLFPQMPPIADPQEIEPMTGKSTAETPDVSDTTVGLQAVWLHHQ